MKVLYSLILGAASLMAWSAANASETAGSAIGSRGNPAAAKTGGPIDVLQLEPAAYAYRYIVWYRFSNDRWRGISGLSYYHASRIRDAYLRRGARAYIKRQ